MHSELLVPASQCDNCYTQLQGLYCHQCGQEKRNILRNVFSSVGEFFGEFSNWDARIWRTLMPLWFKPGRLTRNYVQGHRVPYVPALCLYLFTSIIAGLLFSQLVSTDELHFQQNQDFVGVKFGTPQTEKTEEKTILSVSASPQKSAEDATFIDELETKLNAKMANLQERPELAIAKFFSLAPQMMFLLLPVFALLMKLLYLRRQRYYLEHLIYCLHTHSFLLHSLIILALLNTMASKISDLTWLVSALRISSFGLILYMLLYLFLSQKHYYQQGWRKTLAKFVILNTVYSVLFSFALTIAIVLSIFWS